MDIVLFNSSRQSLVKDLYSWIRLSVVLSPANLFNLSKQVSLKLWNPVFLPDIKLVDIKATLIDGSYHDVDSSEMAFKIAGSMAFKDGTRKGNPVILEPVFKVEVITPDEYMGDVIGDSNSRRGHIEGMEARGAFRLSKGLFPWSKCSGMLQNYASKLKDAVFIL